MARTSPPRCGCVPLTGLPGGSGPALALFAILLGASAAVLVIAGVNVAALLSARYTEQSPRSRGPRGARRRPPAFDAPAPDRGAGAVRTRHPRRRHDRDDGHRGPGTPAAARDHADHRWRSRRTSACSPSPSLRRWRPAWSSDSARPCKARGETSPIGCKSESAGAGRRRSRLGQVLVGRTDRPVAGPARRRGAVHSSRRARRGNRSGHRSPRRHHGAAGAGVVGLRRRGGDGIPSRAARADDGDAVASRQWRSRRACR